MTLVAQLYTTEVFRRELKKKGEGMKIPKICQRCSREPHISELSETIYKTKYALICKDRFVYGDEL